MTSYHDIYITTRDVPRTSLFDLPYDFELTCNRVGGWTLWQRNTQIAGEYGNPLRIELGVESVINPGENAYITIVNSFKDGVVPYDDNP